MSRLRLLHVVDDPRGYQGDIFALQGDGFPMNMGTELLRVEDPDLRRALRNDLDEPARHEHDWPDGEPSTRALGELVGEPPGQGLRLPHRVASELDSPHQEALPIVLQHGVSLPRLAIRLRFEDENPVRGHDHMVDVQALTDQVVEDTRPVRP